MKVGRLLVVIAWMGVCLGAFHAHILLGFFATYLTFPLVIRVRIAHSLRPLGRPTSWWDTEAAILLTSAAVLVLIGVSDAISFVSPICAVVMGGRLALALAGLTVEGLSRDPWLDLLLATVLGAAVVASVAMTAISHLALARRFWRPFGGRRATLRASAFVLLGWALFVVELVGLNMGLAWSDARSHLEKQTRAVDDSRGRLERARRCLVHVEIGPGRCADCQGRTEREVRAKVGDLEEKAAAAALDVRAGPARFVDSPTHRWRFAWALAIGLPPLLDVPRAIRLRRELATPSHPEPFP